MTILLDTIHVSLKLSPIVIFPRIKRSLINIKSPTNSSCQTCFIFYYIGNMLVCSCHVKIGMCLFGALPPNSRVCKTLAKNFYYY